MPDSMTAAARRPALRALALLLLAVTLAVFVRGVGGRFVYDDFYLIESNPSLRHPGGLARIFTTPLWSDVQAPERAHWVESGRRYYRPFVKLALVAQYHLFELHPAGYHLVSLVLHLACVLLAFRWLRGRLVRSRPESNAAVFGGASAAAAFGAALFALHPSRPEVVSWISGSMDLWMAFWILVGLTAWDAWAGWRGALATGAAFALALLCKEVAIVVPLCLALDALAWARPRAAGAAPRAGNHGARAPSGSRSGWPLTWTRLAVMTLALVLTVAMRLLFVPAPVTAFSGSLERIGPRVLASIGLYAGRVLWPWPPSTQIGLMGPEGDFELAPWSIVLGAVLALAYVALALLALRRRALRPWLADASWCVLPLVPVLNIVPLGYTMLVADRFLYLPLLGVAAVAARALRPMLRPGRRRRPYAAAVLVAVVALWSALACVHVGHFASEERLWAHESAVNGRNPLPPLYLARASWRSGHLDAALAEARTSYERAMREDARADAAVTWASIRLQQPRGLNGDTLLRLRAFFDAIADPSGGPARLEMEGVDLQADPSPEARRRLRETASFRMSRAVTHARTLDLQPAELELRALWRDDPSPAAAANLVRVLAYQGRWGEADSVLESVLRSYPEDAALRALREPLQRGTALEQESDAVLRAAAQSRLYLDLGSTEMARRALQPALAAQPDRGEVVIAAALVQAADGDVAAARRTLEAGRARDAAHAALWDAALADLSRLAAPARVQELDALFR